MKKFVIALALSALAHAGFGMGNKPNELGPAVSAAQGAASSASASANAASADRAAVASMRTEAASAAAMSAVNAAGTAEERQKAEKAAARADKDLQALQKNLADAKAGAQKGCFKWQHFGADPYAKSRDEAMQKRREAFVAMQLPPAVVERLMKATEEAGERVSINNGQRLDVMMEGSGPRRGVCVEFEKPPVPNMAYSAPAEMWQVSVGGTTYKVYLPDVCNNWSLVVELPPVKVTASASPAAPPAKSAACPAGWTITVHAWSLASLPSGMRREAESLIEAARQRDSQHARVAAVYKPDDVSRTLGGRLRKDVRVHAAISPAVHLYFLDPQSLQVVRDLGALTLSNGQGDLTMPEDPRTYIVETVFTGEFVSPTISGGERRLRLFPYEWGKWCQMNEHGLVP